MANVEDRIRDLAAQHLNLGRELNLDIGLDESDVSSLDAVAFVKTAGETFGIEIPAAEVARFRSLRDVVNYLDSYS